MPRVKATKTSKTESVLQDLSEKLYKLYGNLCNCTIFCSKCFLVESHRNAPKHQMTSGSITLQTFLKSSNTDFLEKVIKSYFHAHIPLYMPNNTYIKTRFYDIGHSLPSKTNRKIAVLQLRAHEFQRTRNAVQNKKFFWQLVRSLYMAFNTCMFWLKA